MVDKFQPKQAFFLPFCFNVIADILCGFGVKLEESGTHIAAVFEG